MSKCCPICYRVGLEVPTSSKVGYLEAKDLQERFFDLLERYIKDDEIGTKNKDEEEGRQCTAFNLQECAKIDMLSCRECLQLMESVCDLYHQLKTIELRLNWKVLTLKKIMEAGERVPSRLKYFRECVEKQDKLDEDVDTPRTCGYSITESVIRSRRSLIKKCSRKLKFSSSFPKLTISKWQPQRSNSLSDFKVALQQNKITETTAIGSSETEEPSRHDVVVSDAVETDIKTCSDPEKIQSDPSTGNPALASLAGTETAIPYLEPEKSTVEDQVACGKCAVPDTGKEADLTPTASSDGVIFQEASDNSPRIEPDLIVSDHDHDMEFADELQNTTNSILLSTKLFDSQRTISPALSLLGLKVEATTNDKLTEQSPSTDSIEGDDDGDISDGEPPSSPEIPRVKECPSRKCSTCGKVFSNTMRLRNHIEEAHIADNDENDSESLSWTSSSDESSWGSDGEDKMSRQTSPCSPEPSIQNTGPAPVDYLLKCPDCNLTFEGTKALLLHRMSAESCAAFYNPAVSIKVEVLAPSEEISANNFTNVYAVINLPQSIFICEQCDLALYSSKDMEEHKKLHGTFSCNFCSFQDSYALNICTHELRHAQRKLTRTKGKFSPSTIRCPRCKFTGEDLLYQRHFINEHLSLTLNKPRCPICKTTIKKYSANGEFLRHLKSHHDLTSQSVKMNGLPNCTVADCSAYFLTMSQLKHHHIQHHVLGNNSKGSLAENELGDSNQQMTETNHGQSETSVSTRPGLRTVHRCSKCNRTFSSHRKLEGHQESRCSSTSSASCCSEVEDQAGKPREKNENIELEHGDIESNTPSTNPEGRSNKAVIRQLPKRPYPALHACKINNCSKKFYSEEDLRNHTKLHGKFDCPLCSSTYTFAPDLAWHEINEHSNDPTKKKFKYAACGPGNMLPCPRPTCSFRHSGKEAYISHHLDEHMGLKYKPTSTCQVCNAIFIIGTASNTNRNIQYHFDTHHNPENLAGNQTLQKCDEDDCTAYFLTARQLFHHKRHVHKIISSYACDTCNVSYKQMANLLQHKRKYHEEELDFPCTFTNCDHRSVTKTGLTLHIKTMHTNKQTQINCPECAKPCTGENGLKYHMEVHKSSGKKWICETCAKEFKNQTQLQVHSLSHSGPESWQYKCSVCSKKCLTTGKLREHMRTHSKEKPFICQLCGEKYAHRHNLRNHVNSKHGDQVQDLPMKVNKPNMTSRKGIKRKRVADTDNKA